MPKRLTIAVWMLLDNGDVWEFCREKSLSQALITARTLAGNIRVGGEVKRERVWIGPPSVLGELPPWRRSLAPVNPRSR
jgi:hypothetical protein